MLNNPEKSMHDHLATSPNRYTERVLEYTANGNVRRFQRHGLKDDGKYGKVDNLHLTYDGNQLVSVLDDAADVTRFASADFPDLSDSSKEYAYKKKLLQELEHQWKSGLIDLYYGDESHVCTEGYVPYAWKFKDEDFCVPIYINAEDSISSG